MKLKAKEDFTCYPDGKTRSDHLAGEEFEIQDEGYAKLLIDKGHADPAGKKAPVSVEQDGK